MTRHLYFAYGSNMHHEHLSRRCPSAEFLVAARLDGYRTAFTRFSPARQCGVLDIVPAAGECVWGGLFSLAAADLTELDLAEAVAQEGYQRILVEVTRHDDRQLATGVVSYQVAAPLAEPVATSTAYLEIVLSGARQCKLPENYLRRLTESRIL